MEPNLTLGNALGFAVQLSLKATAVLLVTALIVLALRRSSAASRHLAASLGLLAVAVLPFASVLLPRWELPVLPSVRLPAAFTFARVHPQPAPVWTVDALPTPPAAAGHVAPPAPPAPPVPPAPPAPPALPFAPPPPAHEGATAPATVPLATATQLVMSGPWIARSSSSLLSRLRYLPLALGLLALAAAAAAMWATGALALLARLAGSAFKVRRTVKAAQPAGSALESLVPEASAAVGLSRKATLLVAADQPVAMTAGSLNPVVLLPEAAHEWTRERTKVVLLHELAHVARSDWEWLLVSEVALAFFWFHPLVWWLHRSVRRDAEQAADDRVLAAGTLPSDYASHLIALVRSLRGDDAPRVSMAMARGSGIESRLRSILDAQRARTGPGRAGRIASIAAAAAAVTLLAAASPTSAGVAQSDAAEGGMLPSVRHAPRRTALDPRQRVAAADVTAEGPRSRGSFRRAEAAESMQEALERAQEAAEQAREQAQEQAEQLREEAEAQDEQAREQAEARAERLRERAEADAERFSSQDDVRGRREAERARLQAEREQVRAEMEQRRAEMDQRRAEIEQRRAELEQAAAEAQQQLAMADHGRGMRGLERNLRSLEGIGAQVGDEVGRAMEEAFSPKVQAKVQRELEKAMGKLADRRTWSWSNGWSRSSSEGGRDWYSKGMELHRKGKYPQAIEAFQKAIAADQRVDDASYNIACGYALQGDVARTIEWLKKAQDEGFDVAGSIDHDDDFDDVRDDPKFRDARKELRKSRGQGEAKAALRKLERVEAKKPKEAGPWDQAGRELLEAGEYDAAAKAFNAAAERSPGKSTYLYNAACALSQKGDKAAALYKLEQAIAAGFDDVSHMKQDDDLADIRGEARFKDLIVMAKALQFPGSMRGFQFGPFRGKKGDQEEELARLQDAAKKYEKVGRAWHNLGYGLLAAGKYAEAEKAFANALSRGYQQGKTLYNLACAAAQQEHKDAALDYLKKSVDAGFSDWEQMKSDEDLGTLHGDARFKALVRASRELSFKEEDDEE
jgi:beta-lactamase regulating signal transducer with metallopeptidase domain/tetratricopeptide (TPR) repeat protein